MTASRLPTYFANHGGGPWPFMDGPFRRMFGELERALVRMRAELGAAAKAVLIVSGHWEEDAFTVSSGERPGMIYDYGGFPKHLYQVAYRAPGSPALAERVRELLSAAGLPVRLDPDRGFDHGTYGIMKPLYPDEDMPVVQLSLQAGLDPALHLAAGKALASLREEGVLILGSGQSYHNLREVGASGHAPSAGFDAWLCETVTAAAPERREARLLRWEDAPFARAAHPSPDHLLPMMVVVGAAGDEPGALNYHETDFAGGLTFSGFRFGTPPDPAQGLD